MYVLEWPHRTVKQLGVRSQQTAIHHGKIMDSQSEPEISKTTTLLMCLCL